MVSNFYEELHWRGMIHSETPNLKDLLLKNKISGYIGFDPTSNSLHIGSLLPIMMLVHFQKHGHTPYILVGGATGMIGDPSGKKEERKLLDESEIEKNIAALKNQLSKFLDFNSKNAAVIVNNKTWFNNYNFLNFLRDVGKYISINYMLAKDSVKSRLETGISFAEFSYQLVQAYDFYFLNQNHNCQLQMGGSDQWGNITTGTELIQKKSSKIAHALTCPLLTNTDGSKFGKSEGGNVWLDINKTSVFKFYQYWINVADEDVVRFLKIFTLFSQEEIENLYNVNSDKLHLRELQKKLAFEITKIVHSENDAKNVENASNLIFGKGTEEGLRNLNIIIFEEIFEGVDKFNFSLQKINNGVDIISLLFESGALASKSEARRLIQSSAISVNQKKVENHELIVNDKHILFNKYILINKGKKNHLLINLI